MLQLMTILILANTQEEVLKQARVLIDRGTMRELELTLLCANSSLFWATKMKNIRLVTKA